MCNRANLPRHSALNGPVVMLRGLNFPESVFVARTGGAVISMAVGIPATWAFGLYGATVGLILASLVTFLIAQILLNRRLSAFPAPLAEQREPVIATST